MTSLLMTPLDVVKVRLQAQSKKFHNKALYLYSNGLMDHLCSVHCIKCDNGRKQNGHAMATIRNNPRYFSGTMDAFVKIVRHEGFPSLYSGLPPTLVMAVPSTVIYFTSYDRLKFMMGFDGTDESTKNIPLIAGPFARLIAATCISPLELFRTKMQSEMLSYKQLFKAMQFSLKKDGVLSFYRGLKPTLLRDIPFSGIYWYSYETFKRICMKRSEVEYMNIHETFICGAAAGCIAAVATQPFDVLKTHVQIDLGERSIYEDKSSRNSWSTLELMREQNFRSLYAGMLPRLMKIMPACAIMISSYEFGKRYFITHSEEQS